MLEQVFATKILAALCEDLKKFGKGCDKSVKVFGELENQKLVLATAIFIFKLFNSLSPILLYLSFIKKTLKITNIKLSIQYNANENIIVSVFIITQIAFKELSYQDILYCKNVILSFKFISYSHFNLYWTKQITSSRKFQCHVIYTHTFK